MSILSGIREYTEKLNLFSHNAWMVLVYGAGTGLAFGVFQLLFNFYILSLGDYTEVFLGTLISFQSIAGLAMALPAAYLSRKFSHKKIMVLSGWGSALIFLGLVTVPYRNFLIAFSLLQGIMFSVRQIAAAPFLMNNTGKEERQWVFSFHFGVLLIAQFVGNTFGGYLPKIAGNLFDVAETHTLAYRGALVMMMFVSIVAVAPLLRIRSSEGKQQEPSNEVTFTRFLSDFWQNFPILAKFITPPLIVGMGAGLMMPFKNLYFRNVLERSDTAIGLLFGIGAFGMAIGQFIAPPITDRIGKIRTSILSEILSIPFLILLGIVAYLAATQGDSFNLTFWFYVAAIAYLFRLSLMNMGHPVYSTFVLEQVTEDIQPIAVSLQNLAFTFGWAVMPILGGWLQETYGSMGFAIIFATVAGFYGLGIAAKLILFRDLVWKKESASIGEAQPASVK